MEKIQALKAREKYGRRLPCRPLWARIVTCRLCGNPLRARLFRRRIFAVGGIHHAQRQGEEEEAAVVAVQRRLGHAETDVQEDMRTAGEA